jgi:formylglycine-generating enzyme required for sulfatase activity
MKQFVKKATAFAVIIIISACVSTESYDNNLFTDAEISSMATLGRVDEAFSGPLYEGDGGKDISLAVLAPELRGGVAGDEWLPVYIQGLLHSNFRKYSAMTLIDRQNLDQIIKEQDLAAGGRFSDKDFISIGDLTNTRYFLTGTVQKLPGGEFAVSLSITDASAGESRASFMKNGTPAALQNGTLLNDASESLLAQMGVTLTETGRRTLTTGRYMAASAEAGYARGVTAEASGASVEALLNFSQAVAFDPSRMEALTRLGSVSSEISGGSVSANILNDLQARRAWLNAMREAAAFFNSHPPFEITYDPNLLQVGITDYENERANLGMQVGLAPSEAGFAALNALLEGLEKTGKREVWGFSGWPFLDITPEDRDVVLFPGVRSFSFTVQVGLVNEAGKVIARGSIKLETGTIGFKAGDKTVHAPEGALGRMNFPEVNIADLTPTLTVVIAGVNGMSARQISETGYMRIAPGDAIRRGQTLEQQRRLEAAGFVFVEGGTFLMGSNNGDSDETPVHFVTLSNFYMGKYEVTTKEWMEIIENDPSSSEQGNYPMSVDWYGAVEYCNRRSEKEGLTPAYQGSRDNITCDFNANGYRLPTEAEWEYAAKGGNKDTEVFEYAGGNNPDVVAWYHYNSPGRIQPVGTKQPNSLGLYDMSGNIMEWCWDWYGSYSSGSQTDPRGASSGPGHVLRGGGTLYGSIRSTGRTNDGRVWPDRPPMGFRLVRSRF